MIQVISDTPATVKDTIAGVNILNQKPSKAKKKSISAPDSIMPSDSSMHQKVHTDSISGYSVIDTTSTKAADSIHAATILKTEKPSGIKGIVRDRNLMHGDIITSVVLACFFITMVFLSVSRSQFVMHTKRFFNKMSKSRNLSPEIFNATTLNLYLIIQTCVSFSTITYIATAPYIDADSIDMSPALIFAAGTLFYLLYFVIKYFLYMLADYVFFEEQRIRRQHAGDLCYIISVQGLLMLPLLLAATSADINIEIFAIYTAAVIILAKLLAFYKTICTFSGHHTSFLQIILYFCALEIIPLMSLYGVLAMVAKYL